jgi:hypothetical protein
LWNDPLGTVPAEELFYRQLSNAQKTAADALCFFENVWNEAPLSEWDELPDDPLTEAPTVPPTEGPSSSPSSNPTAVITVSPAPSSIPSADPTASGPTTAPSAAPTRITESPSASPTTAQPTAASDAPTVDIRKPPVEEINYPDFRYVLWKDLDVDRKISAEALDWTETTWNNPGQATIETFAFEDLPDESQDEASSMGFDDMSWNCYINHFDAFVWSSLEDLDVQKYFITLGWSRQSWEGEIDPPASDETPWVALTAAEQNAATELCYTKEMWEGIPLEDWPPQNTEPPSEDDSTENVSYLMTKSLLASTFLGVLMGFIL